MTKFMEKSITSLKVNKDGIEDVGLVKLQTIETMVGLLLHLCTDQQMMSSRHALFPALGKKSA